VLKNAGRASRPSRQSWVCEAYFREPVGPVPLDPWLPELLDPMLPELLEPVVAPELEFDPVPLASSNTDIP